MKQGHTPRKQRAPGRLGPSLQMTASCQRCQPGKPRVLVGVSLQPLAQPQELADPIVHKRFQHRAPESPAHVGTLCPEPRCTGTLASTSHSCLCWA